jgi:hypothetical protein
MSRLFVPKTFRFGHKSSFDYSYRMTTYFMNLYAQVNIYMYICVPGGCDNIQYVYIHIYIY